MEAEFLLLTGEEASSSLVGKGRDDPEGLSEPKYVLSHSFIMKQSYTCNNCNTLDKATLHDFLR